MPMQTRAAVCRAAGQALTLETLERINEGFTLMRRGESIRTIVSY